MDSLARIHRIKILYLFFWISLYGGIELGCLHLWDDLKPLREFCFLLGWIFSTLLSWLVIWRTLKNKGYVNFLWPALPVATLWGIDLFLRESLVRPFLITFVFMVVLWKTLCTCTVNRRAQQAA